MAAPEVVAVTEYRFVTRWRLRATADEVWEILHDVTALPRWWPSVYLSALEVDPGTADGVGRVVSLRTRSWLPYIHHWSFRVTGTDAPRAFTLRAFGDLEGTGRWTLVPCGDEVDVVYDWRVRVERPLLRVLSVALRPAFAANHQWAMDHGRESLALELLRRRTADPEVLASIPAPPAPTPESPLPLVLGTLGAVASVAGAAVLLLRRRRPPA